MIEQPPDAGWRPNREMTEAEVGRVRRSIGSATKTKRLEHHIVAKSETGTKARTKRDGWPSKAHVERYHGSYIVQNLSSGNSGTGPSRVKISEAEATSHFGSYLVTT